MVHRTIWLSLPSTNRQALLVGCRGIAWRVYGAALTLEVGQRVVSPVTKLGQTIISQYDTFRPSTNEEKVLTLCMMISRKTWSSLSSVRGAAYTMAQTASSILPSGSVLSSLADAHTESRYDTVLTLMPLGVRSELAVSRCTAALISTPLTSIKNRPTSSNSSSST